MALALQLLNVILNIGKGHRRIRSQHLVFKIPGPRSSQPEAGLKHAAGQMGEDPLPDWTEAGAAFVGADLTLPRGLCDQPVGGVAADPGLTSPLLSRSLDLPSFTLCYLGRAGLQGIETACAALRIPGRGRVGPAGQGPVTGPSLLLPATGRD